MSRRRGARDRTWPPPGPWQPPSREQVAAAPAERPSWPRTARPSLGQSAATAARLGQGLPPAAVEDLAGGELVDVDPAGPAVCPSCGRRHEAPDELRPSPMARPSLAGPGDSAALTRDGFRPRAGAGPGGGARDVPAPAPAGAHCTRTIRRRAPCLPPLTATR